MLSLEQLEHRLVLSNFPPVIGPLDAYEVNENAPVMIEGTFTDEYASGAMGIGLDPAAYASLGTFDPASNVTIDTTTLTMSGGASFTGIEVGGIAVFTFDSIDVDGGITVTGTGSRPLALLSQTYATIGGVIDVSATTTVPGPGGGAGGVEAHENGQPAVGAPESGAGRGAEGGTGTTYARGGGGGANGGDGGQGSSNSGGQAGGAGGIAYGDLQVALLAGSGGGASSGGTLGGRGGNGGGAIEIGAVGTLTLAAGGQVLAVGSLGIGGGTVGGGGGGAGGGILLHGFNVGFSGTLDVTGGNGGAGVRGGGGGGGGCILIAHNTAGTYLGAGSYSVAGGLVDSGSASSMPGEAGTFNVVAVEGGTPEVEDFTFSIDWGDGTPLDTGDATITTPGSPGVPTAGSFGGSHTYGDNDEYTVTVTVQDGLGGSDTATTTVTVNNVAPTANGDTAMTDEDQAVSIDVLGNDTDPAGLNDPLTVVELDGTAVAAGDSVTLGSGATVMLNADGTVTYTPVLGFVGADSFGYMISDGDGGTATGMVEVTVNNLVDVSGRVFDDLDNDGAYEPGDGDAGIPGVTVEIWDETLTALLGSTVTGGDGAYLLDVNLGPGTYKVVEAIDELAELGLLDGKETAGNLGGTVDNTQDSNQITIAVSDPPSTVDAVDYLFAEIRPSNLFGRVWRDFNDDGEINFDEQDVNDVEVTLIGTDDRGNSVSLTATTSDDLGFAFTDLRPGTYAITETQPADYDDGQEVLGEVTDLGVPTAVADPGVIDGNDRFSSIELVPGSMGDHYNFGELPQAGEQMPWGSTASICFWHNWTGQALIRHLSDYAAAHGGSPTQLGDWLAATFPEVYGEGCVYDAKWGPDRDMNFAGKSDLYIAQTFQYLHARNRITMVAGGGVPRVDAQVLALALATFATNESLAGTIARYYWFNTSEEGIAYTTFNVLNVLSEAEAEALGLSQANGNMDANGNVTIIDILQTTNQMSTQGLLYDSHDTGDGSGDGQIDCYERWLRMLANRLYCVMNGWRWW